MEGKTGSAMLIPHFKAGVFFSLAAAGVVVVVVVAVMVVVFVVVDEIVSGSQWLWLWW